MLRDEPDIEEILGLHPSIGKKLREAGYTTVESIAVASPSEIASVTDIPFKMTVEIIRIARKKLT